MSDNIKQRRTGWEHRAMSHLKAAQKAAFVKLLLDAFLKKTLQLKIQVSLYAIHRGTKYSGGTAKNGFENVLWGPLVPIIVTLLTGFASQLDLFIMCIKRQFEVNKHVKSRYGDLDDDDQSLYTLLMRNSCFIT